MITTGKRPLPVLTFIAIMSVCFIINLPGVAVSPIEGKLREILHTSELEIQLLTTLPNFVIIPFVLLAGKLSASGHKLLFIFISLIVFIGCGFLYIFASSMKGMIVASCFLGAADGILIPFAMGFIVNAFYGKYRTRNLGFKSATSNLGTVVAGLVVGVIMKYDWHLTFLIYLVAFVPLALAYWLKYIPGFGDIPIDETIPVNAKIKLNYRDGIELGKIAQLMGNNFYVTVVTFAIILYFPQLIQQNGGTPETSGDIMAVFFISVLCAGFVLNLFLKIFKSLVFPLIGLLMAIGLGLIVFIPNVWSCYVGSILVGFVFGIFQPLIYDKASFAVTNPAKNILALSLVLCALYIGIAAEPFIITALSDAFHVKDINIFAFRLSFYMSLAYIIFSYFMRKKFAFLISPAYYT